MRGYRVWLDRGLSVVTVLAGLTAAYLVATERVIPALRGGPVPVDAGEELAARLEFERLAGSSGSGGGGRIEVPGEGAVLLLLYNSSCPACYANVAAWDRVVRAAAGIASVLSVALDRDLESARAYARRHLPSTVAVVPRRARRLTGALGIGIIPATALIDGDGVVLFLRQGSLDRAAVDSLVSALEALAGPTS